MGTHYPDLNTDTFCMEYFAIINLFIVSKTMVKNYKNSNSIQKMKIQEVLICNEKYPQMLKNSKVILNSKIINSDISCYDFYKENSLFLTSRPHKEFRQIFVGFVSNIRLCWDTVLFTNAENDL